MHIPLKTAIDLFNEYPGQNLSMAFLSTVRFQLPGTGQMLLRSGTRFTAETGNMLAQGGVDNVDMIYNEKLMSYLRKEFKDQYRLPYEQISFFQMDKTISAFKEINKKSMRQRKLISLSEIYKKEGSAITVLIEYGEEVDFAKWNNIKTKIDKKQRFDVKYDENGIIVFVDLRPEGENYLQRFYKNSDLVTSLVGRKTSDSIRISPDFIRETDVYTVDDPTVLLDEYIKKKARLILIGDTLSPDYKNALAKVKTYDKFARFMLAMNIDQRNLDSFLEQVKKSYCSDNFSIDDY
ncbi:MAG: hypothetical protein KAS64_01880 [Spirochaetes bacterium]|nr:hypothetical protein [Spirochaetota bacterium]